ncbi:MAG TPA: UDP-N-acetylmuramoyl-L-alanine--D-glutamate ligase [Actinomycetota bacterium]|nr:UDP-N-acetylmuramoyl-L-alanine--D-glutamate ligase [Actinomycetota bacterium]
MSGAFAGERVLVVGYGASGRAAVRVLLEEGARVRVSEARPADRVEELPPLEVEFRAGGHRPTDLEGVSLVVLSPGVPEHAPVVRWARRARLRVWSELELGARLCRVPYVAVTGTNGKTTTVELVAAMMREAGLRARACGNVGYPFSLAAREPGDALAVEASSFQLRFHETLHPRVSVLLNLAPDHLDWHGSFEAYAAAKARVFLRQRPEAGDVHVGNRDDPQAAGVSRRAPCEVRWFGWGAPRPGEVGVVEGRVVALVGGRELDLGRPPAPSRSLALDAAAAAAAALAFGLPPEAVRRAVERFVPLPHRGTVVAEAGGVRFVDDSKATNPHAALAALEGRSDVVLVAGGLAKGVDLSPLAAAAPALRAVVAVGEAAPELERVFEGLLPVRRAGSMEEAVEAAYALAAGRGVVLLAPACASQDMFADYAERGDRFARAAAMLARGEG